MGNPKTMFYRSYFLALLPYGVSYKICMIIAAIQKTTSNKKTQVQ
jgi:hypothetical protein